MNDPSFNQQSSHSELINELIEDYLEQAGAGTAPSLTEYVKLHPQYADELMAVLETVQVVNQLAPQVQTQSTTEDFPEIEDYHLLRVAGRGGMGVVYEAIQVSLDRRVALKVLPNSVLQNHLARERFQLEARTAAKLHHSNIVPVYEVGEHGGHCFYAMQFIEGDPLDAVVRKLRGIPLLTRPDNQLAPAAHGNDTSNDQRIESIALLLNSTGFTAPRDSTEPRLSEKPQALLDTNPIAADASSSIVSQGDKRPFFVNVAQIGCQAAEALHYAHEHGIVHRDIKPSNLILDTCGHLWITDFGLAKLNDTSGLTRVGDVVGTLRYIAPERFSGKCDGRSDIYSLGVTLFELIALQAPFESVDRLELIEQIKQSDAPSLRKLNRRVPYDLQTIVEKAMHPLASRRYATALALTQDLQKFIDGEPIRARRVGATEQLWMWARRNPATAALMSSLLLGLVLVAIVAVAAAMKFKEMADAQTQLARREQDAQQEAAANLYYAETNLVSQDLEATSNIDSVRDYLGRWLPLPGEPDQRGWEWQFLQKFAYREQQLLDLQEIEGLEASPYVSALQYSPDGKFLAHSLETEVLVRAADSLQIVARFSNNPQLVYSLAFSHDGQKLAVASEEGGLCIWDWKNETQIQNIPYDEAIGSISWRPDDQEIVFIANGFTRGDDSVHVVDVTSGEITRSLMDNIGHHARVNGYTTDGKFFTLAMSKQQKQFSIAVLETKNWNVVAEKLLHTQYVYNTVWHHDNQTIASASLDGTVSLWNYVTDESRTIHTSQDGVVSVGWSPDGRYLAIGGWDNLVRIWDFEQNRLCDSLRGHSNRLHCLDWNPETGSIASADWNGQIRTWQLEEPGAIQEFTASHSYTDLWFLDDFRIAWPENGTLIVSHSGDRVMTWDMQHGSYRRSPTLGERFHLPCWSPSGQFIADARDGPLRIFNAHTFAEISQHSLSEAYRGLGWTHHEHQLLLTEDRYAGDKFVWRFDIADSGYESKPKKLAGPFLAVYDAQESPDGKRVAIAGRREETSLQVVVDLQSGHTIKELKMFDAASHPSVLMWSPDGATLVAGGEHGTIEIWNALNWTRSAVLKGHAKEITDLVWNRRHNRLASSSRDGTIRIWDTNSFRTVLVLRHDTEIAQMSWNPSENQLASISIDGVIKVWDGAPQNPSQQE